MTDERWKALRPWPGALRKALDEMGLSEPPLRPENRGRRSEPTPAGR